MLDAAVLRDNPDTVRTALQNRGLDAGGLLAELGALDERRRALIVEVETLKRAQNASGEEVARLKRLGEDASGVFDANRQRGQQIKELDALLQTLEEGRLRGRSSHQPIWIGLTVATLMVWLLATILSIALPVVETGTDPTRLPIAALVTPAAAAVLTGLAGIIAGVFARPPQAG